MRKARGACLPAGLALLSVAALGGCRRSADNGASGQAPAGLPSGGTAPVVSAAPAAAPATASPEKAPPIDPAIEKELLAAANAEHPDDTAPSAGQADQPPAQRPAADPHDPHAGMENADVDPSTYDPTMVVSGLIDAAPSVRAQASACRTLFVIAHQAGGDHSLVAVRKLDVASGVPLAWALDGSMAMMAGAPKFAGPVTITARTDRDGDGLTRDSGCLETSQAQTVTVPAQHVRLMLDSVLP